MRIDRTRSASRKARAISRASERRAKSARLFLAFAFPADLRAFGVALSEAR